MFQQPERIQQILDEGFANRHILVVGDLILDHYIEGQVQRISPEAPVPVVQVRGRRSVCGGAANVVANLRGLRVATDLLGITGADPERETLLALLARLGVDCQHILEDERRPTVSKTRIIGGHQQMLRLDQESVAELDADLEERLLQRLHQILDARPPQIMLLSDYAKGTLSRTLCRQLIALANDRGIPLLVDPKGLDFSKYRGATAILPNRSELCQACQLHEETELAELLAAAEQLRQRLGLDYLIATLGEQGIALLDGQAPPRTFPAMAREVFDVSGAGDTVLATTAAGLAAGLALADCLHLANLAAGEVVAHVGTAPIDDATLRRAIQQERTSEQADKIQGLQQARETVGRWRSQGQRLVFTNGCFDLLHAGHVSYLEQAARLGDRLVVGLNSDASVRELKGKGRPMIREQQRARVLAALASVDLVVLFCEPTPLNLIVSLRPDVLAKGADYREEQIAGAREVRTWGGTVELIPLVAGLSSSAIAQRIQETPES